MQRARIPAPSGTHGSTRSSLRRTPAPRPRRRLPGAANTVADNLGAQSRRRSEAALERDADARGRRIERGTPDAPRISPTARNTLQPTDSGRPLSGSAARMARSTLGEQAGQIRLHDDPLARLTASALQARAFADGRDIWLGPGESEHDRALMAHEMAHVAQGEPGLHLRSATWLERRAWLSFFDHYLPRKFLNNYMDDSGAPITLGAQEMIDINPIVNIRRSEDFATELAALQAQVKASNASEKPAPAVKYLEVKGPGQAMTNGTLGNFTITYKGILTVHPDGNWTFIGTMEFYDVWDFDPKPFGTSGRSTAGEVKTRVAANFLPGRSFEIFSVPAFLVQSGADRRAVWAGGAPQFVNDRAGRAGADIEVGTGGGEVGGPVGETGGGEVGAQSAEDLNP
jgi:hypothetical protein